MLSIAWAHGGWIGMGIIVAFALTFALVALGLAALAVVIWTFGNAVLDAVASLSPKIVFSEGVKTTPAATVR